jgi:hypothetical protein
MRVIGEDEQEPVWKLILLSDFLFIPTLPSSQIQSSPPMLPFLLCVILP